MKKFFLIASVIAIWCSCNTNNYIPGFDFNLFKNTPVWELAKAVEKEDTELIGTILKDTALKVDYHEPKYGNTLLMLAVVNNKVKSVEALLKNRANPNLPDYFKHDNPVSTLCREWNFDGNCDTSIMSLLLKYGGNVNYQLEYIDTIYGKITTDPLGIATYAGKCLDFIKVLVEHGADINGSNNEPDNTPVAGAIFSESLNVAKYLIIEKKARVPEYCFIRPKGEKPYEQKITITDFLNEKQYEKGSENYKLREEIINYLKSKALK